MGYVGMQFKIGWVPLQKAGFDLEKLTFKPGLREKEEFNLLV